MYLSFFCHLLLDVGGYYVTNKLPNVLCRKYAYSSVLVKVNLNVDSLFLFIALLIVYFLLPLPLTLIPFNLHSTPGELQFYQWYGTNIYYSFMFAMVMPESNLEEESKYFVLHSDRYVS